MGHNTIRLWKKHPPQII